MKTNTEEPNILLTGGHAGTTGISVIEEIVNRYPKAKISWIGTKSVIRGSSATSLEYKIYPKLGIKYYSISAGKLQTKFTRNTIPLLFNIPVGFVQAFSLLLKIKPNIIVSFGGFTSFPVVFCGWILRIPMILHEQTVAAGRASIAEAFFVNVIALARESSLKFFPKSKCRVVGNPLSKEFLASSTKRVLHSRPTILIVGGSRGSEFINEEVSKYTFELIKKYHVIHITGELDFDKYTVFRNKDYEVLKFIEPSKMPELYQKADLIISRAGANSVSEIIYMKLPAILIPLPRTYMDEQYKNAKYAESFGIARVMSEKEVSDNGLIKPVESVFANWQKIVSSVAKKPSPDIEASKKVVDLITEYV